MDGKLEDNIANGLIFCTTFTSHRSGHTPFVQTRAETSDTRAEAVEPDPRCPLHSQEFCSGHQSSDVRPIVPFISKRFKIGVKHQ